jgi:hypothetical protein
MNRRLALLAAAGLLLTTAACRRPSPAGPPPVIVTRPVADAGRFTRANFDRLAPGMTVGEVETVLGPLDGLAPSRLARVPPGAEVVWTGYDVLPGQAASVRTAGTSTGVRFAVTLRFQGDKLVGKEQQGLE